MFNRKKIKELENRIIELELGNYIHRCRLDKNVSTINRLAKITLDKLVGLRNRINDLEKKFPKYL